MAFTEVHTSVAEVDRLIRTLPNGATKTELQAAFDRMVDRLANTVFNELPIHVAAQRRAS